MELYASHEDGHERPSYQRLIGDAWRGDQSLFAREDSVEAAWCVVDGVLGDAVPPVEYRPGSWGPATATLVLAAGDRWHDPVAALPTPDLRRGAPRHPPAPD